MTNLKIQYALLHSRKLFRTSPRRNFGVRSMCLGALPLPAADNELKDYSPKIVNLVNEISRLNLVEVSDLNNLLKKTLNIKDTPFASFSSMPASKDSTSKDSEEAPISQKTSFTVKITKFDETKKIGIIKEIKNIVEGMNLVQAKKYVESLPQIVKADIGKDEADKLKDQLIKCGATIVIE